MILAANQPCYLPAVDFFNKMSRADVFVLADDVQYSTNALINRARIKTAQGAGWLTMPVRSRGRSGQRIADVEFDVWQNWRVKHWRTLLTNYTYAGYFEDHADFFENFYLSGSIRQKLLEVNVALISYVIDRLQIHARILLSSDLHIKAEGKDWIYKIASATGCDTYLADSRFASYLTTDEFVERGLRLDLLPPTDLRYYQQFGDFVPGLSIVDLLFNEGVNGSRTLMAKS